MIRNHARTSSRASSVERLHHLRTLSLHRLEPAPDDRVDEVLAIPEVVVDRGVVALAGRNRDVAQWHLDAALGDQPFGRIQNVGPGSFTTVHLNDHRNWTAIKRICLNLCGRRPGRGDSMTSAHEIREIDMGKPMQRFARGWHCVGLAEDFRDGKPHGINAFGTRLVVFADSQGDLQVLDGYCRHMGGDLSQGTSRAIRWRARSTTGAGRGRPASARWCPTPSARHGWPGPGAGRPARSTASCWSGTTRRVDPPPAEWFPPTIDGYDEGSGRRGRGTRSTSRDRTAARSSTTTSTWRTSSTSTTPIPTYFKNVIEGHTATQFMESKARPDFTKNYEKLWEGTKLRSEATYFGPPT